MINVSKNGIIDIVRGDTGIIEVDFNDWLSPLFNKEYFSFENTIFYFAIMEPNQPFEKAIVRKKITDEIVDNKITITIDSTDTELLFPGKYYYSLKATREENGKLLVDTIIPNRLFNIL